MFLTPYRAKTVDPFFGTELLPALRRWMDLEDGKESFRLPQTNIHETDKAYVLTMEVPGVNKKHLDVNVEGNDLIVSAEKAEKTEAKGLLRREIRSEKFRRSFTLDNTVDRGQISAKLEDGILRITLPKTSESVGRQIDVE